MFILPSRGRPENMKRLIAHSKPRVRALIILDDDDAPKYKGIKWPAPWVVVIWPRARIGEHTRRAFAEFGNEPWYGPASDDILPEPGWDLEIEKRITQRSIIWPHDGDKGNCTFPMVGGDFVRAAGFFAPPGFKHFYIDNVWFEIARALGIDGLVREINFNHLHFTNRKAPFDDTYRNRPPVPDDKAVFEKFMANDFEPLVDRLKCLM